MAIKRVSDLYASGIQAFTGTRRPRPPRDTRQPPVSSNSPLAALAEALAIEVSENFANKATVAVAADRAPAPKPSKPDPNNAKLDQSTERAIADIAADIGKLRRTAERKGEVLAPVDYHDIIANTVASLTSSTVEARHAVYECARQVVHQRLSRTRPALSAEALDRERLALDQAIEKIESQAREVPHDSFAPDTAPAAPQAAAAIGADITAPRRELPQAKHFHGGALRVFGIAALLCICLFGYWLATGKPEFRSAVSYLNDRLPGSPANTPAEPEPTTPAETTAAVEPQQPEPPATSDPKQNEIAVARVEPTEAQPPVGFSPVTPPAAPTASPGPQWLPMTSAIAPATETAVPEQTAGKNAAGPPPGGSSTTTSTAARAAFERGMLQSKGPDPERAIREFTDALRADPNFSDAYLQRGNMRFKNGNADQAVNDFNISINVEPRNAAAFKARGMALLYLGNEDQALEDLTRAIQIAEADATRLSVLETFFARRSRSQMYSRRQIGERELFDLSAMIDAYWKNPELADALKQNYGVQGSAALMASIYRQRAGLYQHRANTDGAIADLSFALQLNPPHALAILAERARVQEAAGRREQAAADLKRALSLNPRFEEARRGLERLNEQQ